MKTPHLIVYDYGMGGLWAVINARSKDEILQNFADIEIMDPRPHWMTEHDYQAIAATDSIDIDDEPSGWLAMRKR